MSIRSNYHLLKTTRALGTIVLIPAVFIVIDYFFEIFFFPGHMHLALDVFIVSCSVAVICAVVSILLIFRINKRLKISLRTMLKNNNYSPMWFDSAAVEFIILIYVVIFRYCRLVEEKIGKD